MVDIPTASAGNGAGVYAAAAGTGAGAGRSAGLRNTEAAAGTEAIKYINVRNLNCVLLKRQFCYLE